MSARLTSGPAFYLVTIGAAVGLGSIWRFPYLAGQYGGGLFIAAFLCACIFIAVPLLVAEFTMGRVSRSSPPRAAGDIAVRAGLSRAWDSIGTCGTLSAFLVFTYYTMIAGWVVAYAVRTASGSLAGASQAAIGERFHAFLADPLQIIAWQVGFMVVAGLVSSFGLERGIEKISKFRAPALLVLLLVLVGYALYVGDTRRGLAFAFAPSTATLSWSMLLAAVSQAFYATGAGMGMMIAYGAYVPETTSLLRTAVYIVVSIIAVSLLATLLVFPLVFRYHLDPAQGPKLVFEVLPVAFAEMKGGQLIGTMFFALLALGALTPAIGTMEPAVAWLQGRGFGRHSAVLMVCVVGLGIGLGSVFSFNLWEAWRPLRMLPGFQSRSFFEVVDFVSANLLMPVGALITSVFIGWVLPKRIAGRRGDLAALQIDRWLLVLLRYVCPVAIVVVLIGSFL